MNALHIILNSARLLEDSELVTDVDLLEMEEKYLPFNNTTIDDAEDSGVDEGNISASTFYAQYPRLQTYLSALNFVVSELATHYFRVPACVTITSSNRKIYLRKLNSMAGIKSVTDINGVEVDYSMADNNAIAFAKDGTYIINFYQIPVLKDIYSKLGFFADRVDFNILSYGVCATYCLMTGRYEQFNAFDTIYRERLPKKVVGRLFNMPAKRWI